MLVAGRFEIAAEIVMLPFDMEKPLVGNYITVCTVCSVFTMSNVHSIHSTIIFFSVCSVLVRVWKQCNTNCCNYCHHNHSNSGIISFSHCTLYRCTHRNSSWPIYMGHGCISLKTCACASFPFRLLSFIYCLLACYNVNL